MRLNHGGSAIMQRRNLYAGNHVMWEQQNTNETVKMKI